MMQRNSAILFRKRLSETNRALFRSRFGAIFCYLFEIAKILLAIALLVHVWRFRKHNAREQEDMFAETDAGAIRSRPPVKMSSVSGGGGGNRGTPSPTPQQTPVRALDAAAFEAVTTAHSLEARKTRILCVCSTTGPRHHDRAIYVRETWGRRCDKLIFASDVQDLYLPSEAFYNTTGREYVSFKMFAAWQWVHDIYINDFDWFLKGDDDTYVIMENVRHFLKNYSPDEAYYFGRPLVNTKSKYHHHYVSGSAQIFSRKTIHRLITEAYPNPDLCPGPRRKANEDAYIGYCLHNIGIDSHDTRDAQKRNRFMIFSSWTHLHVGSASATNWVWRYDKTYVEGEGCCSPEAISLHYMPGGKMLAMEYLIYRNRPFGVSNSAVLRPCL